MEAAGEWALATIPAGPVNTVSVAIELCSLIRQDLIVANSDKGGGRNYLLWRSFGNSVSFPLHFPFLFLLEEQTQV